MAKSIRVRSGHDAQLLTGGLGRGETSNDLPLAVLASIAMHVFILLAIPSSDARPVRDAEIGRTEIFTLELIEPPPEPMTAARSAGAPGPAGSPVRAAIKRAEPLGLPVLPELPDIPDVPVVEPEFRAAMPVPVVPDFELPPITEFIGSRKRAATGGGGNGASEGSGGGNGDAWSEYVAFSPMMVKPEIRNRSEVSRFLERHYQPILRKTGATGVVMLAVWIDEEGKAQRAEVMNSSGHAELDEAALLLTDVIRFSPAIHMGKPVKVKVEFPVRFQERTR